MWHPIAAANHRLQLTTSTTLPASAASTRAPSPDGASIVIENMPASDVSGYAGLADKVDFHTFRLLKGIVLSTLLGVGTELSFGDSESDLVEALRESAQSSANQVGQRIVQRNLDIQPTIKIRPGWPFRIIVHKDLVLRPYSTEGAIR